VEELPVKVFVVEEALKAEAEWSCDIFWDFVKKKS